MFKYYYWATKKYCIFIREWSSSDASAIGAEDFVDTFSSFDELSYFSYDQKKKFADWHFPLIHICEDDQWILIENSVLLNESNISEICHIFKNKVLCEFQTEIFLQRPFIIQVILH